MEIQNSTLPQFNCDLINGDEIIPSIIMTVSQCSSNAIPRTQQTCSNDSKRSSSPLQVVEARIVNEKLVAIRIWWHNFVLLSFCFGFHSRSHSLLLLYSFRVERSLRQLSSRSNKNRKWGPYIQQPAAETTTSDEGEEASSTAAAQHILFEYNNNQTWLCTLYSNDSSVL